MRTKVVFNNPQLEEKLLHDLETKRVDEKPDLLVISRKWEKGGTEKLVDEVKKAVIEGCSYVIPVLGVRDRTAEEIWKRLEALGVPPGAVLYGNPVRYSQLLKHIKNVIAQNLVVDPVVWVLPEEENIVMEEETAEDVVFFSATADEPAKRESVAEQAVAGQNAGETVEEKTEPVEPADGPNSRIEPANEPVAGKTRVVWFTSPAPGTGQTTLVSSVAAMIKETAGEKVVLVDFCYPAAACLRFKEPEFAEQEDYLIAHTKWGDLVIPREPRTTVDSAAEFVSRLGDRGYDWIFADTPPGWDTREYGVTVTVLGEDLEQYKLLQKTGPGDIIVLNKIRRSSPGFLQEILKNEFGRRVNVVIRYDPDAIKAVDTPAALQSSTVSRGAGEIISLLVAGDR